MKRLKILSGWRFYGMMASLAILTLVILACGEDAAPTPTRAPAATATPVPTATSVPEPVVSRIVVAMPPMIIQETLPRKAGFGGVIQIRPAFDFLIGNDRVTYKFEPQLATSWSISTDGKTWGFKLKEGVFFNDPLVGKAPSSPPRTLSTPGSRIQWRIPL